MTFENVFPNLIFASLFFTVTAFFWNQNPNLELKSNSGSNENLGISNSNFQKISLPDIGVWISSFLLSIFLLLRWIESGHPPMSNLYESLIFLTWSFLFFYLILTKGVGPKEESTFQRTVGMILLSTALFTYTFANWRLPSSMQVIEPLVPALQSNWLLMHVSIMLLSYGALLSGSLMAITYLVIHSILRSKTPISQDFEIHQSSTLLMNLDSLSARSLGFAFPMLTLGIISGAVWANEAWGSYWSWDPKETWALITWFIFAIYLHIRINKGWVGQKAAIVATLGFFLIWVCYLGVNLLGKGLHSYGWWNS